ncbi:MAG: hypothetical protein HY066_14205 [Betaproteobacteria bacterium]|nr:hypothetical protein [Betaproteobacteria bacterium]
MHISQQLRQSVRRLIFRTAVASIAIVGVNVHGATTDLSNVPLVSSSSTAVLPNLMFVLDDSGSMSWSYMPDTVGNFAQNYGYSSSQCNGVYYDPAVTYTPPVDSTGASYPNSNFTAAWNNGYNTGGGGVTDLSTGFKANSGDTAEAAYYYTYSGTQTTAVLKNYYNTSSTFYQECNSNIGSAPGSGVFTKVTVPVAQQQNFANWYSYYRTRMLMMKTSAGLAFRPIDNHYRVGFMTINNNVSPDILNIATFDSTQKSAWYAKLYSSSPGNSTPLREALTNAGRIYAGKLTSLYGTTITDPIQYSCQQNFTILSTDGFWNGTSGYKVNGSTAIGNEDGGEVRPMYDGGGSTVTASTPTTTVVRSQTVTDKTITTVWRRNVYSLGANGADGCSSTRKKIHQQQQRRTETKQITLTSVDDASTVSTRVIVTTNGTVTSDTTNTTNNTANVSTNTATNSDTFTAWTDYGSYTTTGSCGSNPSLPSPNPSNPSTVSTNTVTTSGPTATVLSTTGPTVGATTTTTTTTGGSSNSLSDVAEYYYVTDLRTSALGNATGVLGTDVSQNNVPSSGLDAASWQHMTTFTLGLGARGRMVFSPTYLADSSGDFFSVKNGTLANPAGGVCSWQASGACNWPTPAADQPEAIDDLWHAAVNGRGTYFSATNPTSLSTALSSALAGVSARTGASAAATTSNPNVTSGDNFVFSSTFTTVTWDGELVRQQLDLNTGVTSSTIDWAARDQLDTKVSRTLYTYDSAAANHLKPFQWANLSGAEQAYFNAPNISSLSQFCASGATCLSAANQVLAAGSSLVSFLRGDRSNEGPSSDTSKYYRQRAHLLGDIVNAEAVYVKSSQFNYADAGYGAFKTTNATRTGMVYAAANDGMLHAFDASSGAESWAYLPSLVLPNLYKLADKNYANLHQYFLDGTPVAGDVYFGGAWHTILVGGMNGGGRGYYALDITDPAAPQALWEFTDTNMGYTYGNPEIVKLADGTWVVLVASGYNNVSPGDGVGRLYVLNAATGVQIPSIPTGISTGVGSTTTPSGLAKIRTWVDNAMTDNTALRVYGGDLLGNVWRFDINNNVGAAGYDAQLLVTLVDGSSSPQPITARPELGECNGTPVVFAGTGKYLGTTDLADTQQQSFYAIKDALSSTTLGNPRVVSNSFVQQTETNTTCPAGTPSTICSTGQAVRTSSTNAVNFPANNGWYVDFPDSGERDNTDPTLALGTLAFNTNVPNNNACTVGGYSFRYFLNYCTGAPVSTSGTVVAVSLGNALATRPVIVKLPNNTVVELTRMSDGTTVTSNVPIGPPPTGARRVSWRELVNDQ